MVQQGYQTGGARYSARAATRKGRAAAGEDAAYPAGRATVQAGLRSYGLSKAEQLRFAHCAPEYREARCAPAEQCMAHAPRSASLLLVLGSRAPCARRQNVNLTRVHLSTVVSRGSPCSKGLPCVRGALAAFFADLPPPCRRAAFVVLAETSSSASGILT